jgi:hypothetical protein
MVGLVEGKIIAGDRRGERKTDWRALGRRER